MVPPTLEQKGLAPTLELLLDNTLKNAGVDYKISIDGITTGLNDKINIGIYRIAQEMINNIIKHSQAKNVLFILALTGNQLTLQVQDDGLGFKEDELKNKTSMGILNIVSRVATLGGVINLKTFNHTARIVPSRSLSNKNKWKPSYLNLKSKYLWRMTTN